MAVSAPALHRWHSGALVPELDCPVPGPSGPPGGGGGGGVTCDVCKLLAPLLPALAHYVASGGDGGGRNQGVTLTDASPVQVGFPNDRRVAIGIWIPGGSQVWHGFTNKVSQGSGQNAGTPLPAGASWLYGPEWTGSVWITGDAPPDIDVRILEITAPP